jgi:hypothetical protein
VIDKREFSSELDSCIRGLAEFRRVLRVLEELVFQEFLTVFNCGVLTFGVQ